MIAPTHSVLDRFRDHAARKPSAPAYVFVGEDMEAERTITYAELDSATLAVATALRTRLNPGDRAILLAEDGPGFVHAFLGCLRTGVIAVPAYPPMPAQARHRVETLRAIAANCEPAAVITLAPQADVTEIRAAVPELAHAWWASPDELVAVPPDASAAQVPGITDIAFLQYTSGSTAAPRGVIVTHGALAHNLEMIRIAFGNDEQTVLAGWLPMFHDMGLIGTFLHPLWLGAMACLMRPMTFLKRPSRWLGMISRYRASLSGGPNFAYDLCTRRVTEAECAGLDLSGWHVAFNGAEPVRDDTLRAFTEKFARYGFDPASWYPCYGLAEATLFVTGGPRQAPPSRLMVDPDALQKGEVLRSGTGRTLVSSGRTWLGRTVLIVDPDTRRPAEDGRIGEIWIGGPALPAGYWNAPDATEQTFAARLADDSEGALLRTGDLGFVRDGELYVTGRCKDLIIVGGRNHYPEDIEATVEDSHSGIRRGYTAVFSYTEADTGTERVVVVANAHHGATGATPEAVRARLVIRRAIQASVAAGHGIAVGDVVLVGPSAVLKTSSGKLRRGATRDAYLRGDYGPADGREASTAGHRRSVEERGTFDTRSEPAAGGPADPPSP
jgi:acyl-CoA synthetase (AMP-forming)/AMP-acid ligase II